MSTKQKILVTGGTGYIGSHITVELQNAGYNVIIIDNLCNSSIDVLDKICIITGKRPEFCKLDMRDITLMDNFFNDNIDIIAVIHCAALLLVEESVKEPLLYFDNNITSILNLLKCMQKYTVRYLVFSSSCTVYGNPTKIPVDEDTPIGIANSPYGKTKQMCEDILKSIDFITVISLRYFNPIGAHTSNLIGEIPHGVPTHLVPYITQTAMGIRSELNVFGSDYNTIDGTCVRDYVHVIDIATAHVCAITRLVEQKCTERYEVYNLGSGCGYSVLQMVNCFKTVTGIDIPVNYKSRRDGDIDAIYADITKANTILGWKSRHTVYDMLLSAWNWEKCKSSEYS